MFTSSSYAIIYGLQLGAAQHMLDFDFLSGRDASVLAFVTPGKAHTNQKLFFGGTEILVPCFPDFSSVPKEISTKSDTCINFASFRSAKDATIEAIESKIFTNIVIIAEGIPQRQTGEIITVNQSAGLNIIGPATVGAIRAGEFRVGNTGGSLENIVQSKLYQKGSVGFVSKSGGMSNELRKIIADTTDGTSISIAIGGDAYNIYDFPTAISNLEKDDDVKMIVLLGEIGGRDELTVAKMIEKGEITKPIVAWCIGTINEHIKGNVQFGHAGAKSNQEEETAQYKNTALKKAGATVPESFMDFGACIEKVFTTLNISVTEPADISDKLETIASRKKTLFTSSISDERGEELLYNDIKISDFTKTGSIAQVIGHLWLKKELPSYALEFINTLLILLSDHGPAVSGSHNAIVTSRAGNDMKSALISGIATIGPRFGGAIDGAAMHFLECLEQSTSPEDFVANMKTKGENIPGIGHKVKSKHNPDIRCSILGEIAEKFPSTKYLDFAKSVEEITLEKKANLILNVDGMSAAMILDIFENIGMSYEEKKMYIESGICNGFFILARSIGMIGHVIDQKRLGEGLYRTPWDDILYS